MKKYFGTAVFLIITILFLFVFHKTFVFKEVDGIQSMTNFYECRENSVDTLFLGSSHVFMNVNNGVLWDEYGIASYDLCASGQPTWNIYFYLKEALKTQHPELIVVDCYTALKEEEFSETPSAIKSLYGMKMSANKIDAMIASVPKTDYRDFILEFPSYHSRYENIKRLDFDEYIPDNYYPEWKGQVISPIIVAQERPELMPSEERKALSPKNEEYLRKIIECAKEEGIPLCLMIAPNVVGQDAIPYFNTIRDIADEYEVEFVDFNEFYDEMNLDFAVDFADAEHLNNNGNIKFSKFLGSYIKENFEVSDRRGESGYEDYEVCANITFMKDYNQDIKSITALSEVTDWIDNKNYLNIFVIEGDLDDLSNRDFLYAMLEKSGIDVDGLSLNKNIIVLNGRDKLWSLEENSELPFIYKASELHTLTVNADDMGNVTAKLNDVEITTGIGLTIYSYDMARCESPLKRFYKIENGEIAEDR